jgi:hypothetical protein
MVSNASGFHAQLVVTDPLSVRSIEIDVLMPALAAAADDAA